MIDAGPDVPVRSGTNARYGLSWNKETFYTWEKGNAARAMGCAQRFDAPPPTGDDIRAVYERWLKEAACLRDLALEPDPPPAFDEFLDTYRTTGPWMPVDGVDGHRLPAAATDHCGLEMIDFAGDRGSGRAGRQWTASHTCSYARASHVPASHGTGPDPGPGGRVPCLVVIGEHQTSTQV